MMKVNAMQMLDQRRGWSRLPDRVRHGLQALLFLPTVLLAAALITGAAVGSVSLATQTGFGAAFRRLFFGSSLVPNLVLTGAGLAATWFMYRTFGQSSDGGSVVAWNRRSLRIGLTGTLLGAGGQAVLVVLGLLTSVYALAWNWGENGNLRLWALYFLAMIFTAVQEEVIFRGYMLMGLGQALGKAPAAVLLSALFGAAHWNQPGFGVAALVGLGLHGFVYSYSVLAQGTVWQAVGLHLMWNLFEGVVFGLPNSGATERFSLWATTVHGPSWWTGGAFGPEAGVLSVVAFLLIFLAMYGGARKQQEARE